MTPAGALERQLEEKRALGRMLCFLGTDHLPGDSGQSLRPCGLKAKNGDKEISALGNNWLLSSDSHWVLSTFY